MKRIAIDLNDVIRDFTNNFVKTYLLDYNREFDTSDFSIWTNDMQSLLPFKTERAYNKFVYEDFSYDLFGKCDTCSRKTQNDLVEFLNMVDDDAEVIIVSTFEAGPTIGYTYLFISKLGCNIREVYLPKDSTTIWDKCDILITANPNLLKCKPENKVSVKIDFEYNENVEADFSFKSFSELVNENNIEKILNNEE